MYPRHTINPAPQLTAKLTARTTDFRGQQQSSESAEDWPIFLPLPPCHRVLELNGEAESQARSAKSDEGVGGDQAQWRSAAGEVTFERGAEGERTPGALKAAGDVSGSSAGGWRESDG